MTTIHVIHDNDYENWVFDPNHPTQGRRFTNGLGAIHHTATSHNVVQHATREATRHELSLVHADGYIDAVLDGYSNEWHGKRLDLGNLASKFAGGTLEALSLLIQGERLAVHLPGAKHHAMREHSSGFCVFGDFAIAADIANAAGLRVAILDTDAHHGDGTEELTLDFTNTMTFSIHQDGIFPYSGVSDYPMLGIYNSPLPALANDRRLQGAVNEFIDVARDFHPDLVFIAAGADGHKADPLSGLHYTEQGYRKVMHTVGKAFPKARFLIGGAGGYCPDDATPAMWANAVTGVADSLS